MREGRIRIASVQRTDRTGDLPRSDPPWPDPNRSPDARLGLALLDASPRVFLAGAGTCRLDARGWGRRGGEPALVERIRTVARTAGFPELRVGIADSGVAADAAARRSEGRKATIVPPGMERPFLAPLPLDCLPISEELRETLHALGFVRIGELADLSRSELEARFGTEGLRMRRWVRGKDERVLLPPLTADAPPVASLELDGAVTEMEPLLFVLRRLLARLVEDLKGVGCCAAGLEVVMGMERGELRTVPVAPARPTLREDLLFDLCRSTLERELAGGRLPEAVDSLAVRVSERSPEEVRQGDFFAREPRDPLAADVALSRLRSRLGSDAVTFPSPRSDHRPEVRNRWVPVVRAGGRGKESMREADPGRDVRPTGGREGGHEAEEPASVLHLLPRPLRIRVGTARGRPATVWEDGRRHRVVVAEGPERLSGDWWRTPYRREYHRLLTEGGEILWVFRENGWWLQGWWD